MLLGMLAESGQSPEYSPMVCQIIVRGCKP